MAYLYTDRDGDEAVKFEQGKYDSWFGYYCADCGGYVLDPMGAMNHENERPNCKENRRKKTTGRD